MSDKEKDLGAEMAEAVTEMDEHARERLLGIMEGYTLRKNEEQRQKEAGQAQAV